MRRVEIAREFGIEKVSMAEILEDVSGWWRYDTGPRLRALKRTVGEVTY